MLSAAYWLMECSAKKKNKKTESKHSTLKHINSFGARVVQTNVSFPANKLTIMDKSLETNLHLWRFCTPQTRIQLHLFGLSDSLHSSYNTEKLNLKFLLSFNINMINIVSGGDERTATRFKKESSALLNFTDSSLHYISALDSRLLSTIVG